MVTTLSKKELEARAAAKKMEEERKKKEQQRIDGNPEGVESPAPKETDREKRSLGIENEGEEDGETPVTTPADTAPAPKGGNRRAKDQIIVDPDEVPYTKIPGKGFGYRMQHPHRYSQLKTLPHTKEAYGKIEGIKHQWENGGFRATSLKEPEKAILGIKSARPLSSDYSIQVPKDDSIQVPKDDWTKYYTSTGEDTHVQESIKDVPAAVRAKEVGAYHQVPGKYTSESTGEIYTRGKGGELLNADGKVVKTPPKDLKPYIIHNEHQRMDIARLNDLGTPAGVLDFPNGAYAPHRIMAERVARGSVSKLELETLNMIRILRGIAELNPEATVPIPGQRRPMPIKEVIDFGIERMFGKDPVIEEENAVNMGMKFKGNLRHATETGYAENFRRVSDNLQRTMRAEKPSDRGHSYPNTDSEKIAALRAKETASRDFKAIPERIADLTAKKEKHPELAREIDEEIKALQAKLERGPPQRLLTQAQKDEESEIAKWRAFMDIYLRAMEYTNPQIDDSHGKKVRNRDVKNLTPYNEAEKHMIMLKSAEMQEIIEEIIEKAISESDYADYAKQISPIISKAIEQKASEIEAREGNELLKAQAEEFRKSVDDRIDQVADILENLNNRLSAIEKAVDSSKSFSEYIDPEADKTHGTAKKAVTKGNHGSMADAHTTQNPIEGAKKEVNKFERPEEKEKELIPTPGQKQTASQKDPHTGIPSLNKAAVTPAFREGVKAGEMQAIKKMAESPEAVVSAKPRAIPETERMQVLQKSALPAISDEELMNTKNIGRLLAKKAGQM